MKFPSLVPVLSFVALSASATPALAVKSATLLTIGDITVIGFNARISVASLRGTNGGMAPACGAGSPELFGIDLATNKGRAQLELAMAAVLSGKTVNLTGGTGCMAVDTASVNIQTLDQLSLNP